MFATINIHLIDTFSYTIIIWQDRMSNKNVSRGITQLSNMNISFFLFFIGLIGFQGIIHPFFIMIFCTSVLGYQAKWSSMHKRK